MEHINTFNNGMNSDISKLFQSNSEYKKAINFRALTEQGASNGSLVNIKGNNCEIAFPDLVTSLLVVRK
jgi:lipopolysaccharide biosynthesis regulator YciM